MLKFTDLLVTTIKRKA